VSVIPLIEHSDLMLATLHPAPFSGENWIFELKYDGFRCLVRKVGSRVELLSRNGKPLNRSFPDVVAAIERLPVDIVNYDVRLHDNYDGRSTGVIVAVNWL
jgi:bifunctional non-homologous end joining protein LigD